MPDAAALQSDYDALLKSEKSGPAVVDQEEVLRALLLQVLENINWEKNQKYLARKIRLLATRNTLSLAMVSLVLVLWPHFFLRPEYIWAHFGLYTALTFGLLGALFSRLRNLQQSNLKLEELRNAQRVGYIIQRGCIGACGAVMVYFFLRSGLVTSNVSPVFDQFGDEVKSVRDRAVAPIRNLALLIIWSFIAGFSESLVPSVLSNTEGQFKGAVSARPPSPGS